MRKILPSDVTYINQVPPKFPAGTPVSYDLELWVTKEDGHKLHRPVGIFASFAVTGDGKNAYVITEESSLQETLNRMEDCIWIAQNAAFDLRQISRWAKIPRVQEHHCTMLYDRILWGGLFNAFSLKDLARRYLELYLPKEARNAFTVESYGQIPFMDGEMLFYNAADAAVTWKIYHEQLERSTDDTKAVWRDIDGASMEAFLDFQGVFIDQVKWMEILNNNIEKIKTYEGSFPFNPNSPAQVLEYCNKTLNLKVENTREQTIEKFKDDHKIIGDLLDYRKLGKRCSTYGLNWIELIEEDGRIYSSWDPNRAESGRTASSNPNLQNVPVRDAPEYRECVVAEKGNLLVGGDYAQQEIRTMAYLSQDKNLIKLLEDGGDIYSNIAKQIGKSRRETKDIVLGINYGMSAYGLAKTMGCDKKTAEHMIYDFFTQFQGVLKWQNQQQSRRTYVTTAYKRRCWLNPYNAQKNRNAINSPNQGSAADMTKLAINLMHKAWKEPDNLFEKFPMILQVHDELIAEVPAELAPVCQGVMEACMLEAGHRVIPGIPIVVEVKIGQKWSEIH